MPLIFLEDGREAVGQGLTWSENKTYFEVPGTI